VAQAVVKPVAETVAPVVKPVVETAAPVAQAVVKPVVEAVVPVTQGVVKPVVEAVAPVTQAVVKPVAETVAPVAQVVVKPVVETASRAARTGLVAAAVPSLTSTRSDASRVGGSASTRAMSDAPTQTATFPAPAPAAPAGTTSDPESIIADPENIIAASAPAAHQFSAKTRATWALHLDGQPTAWATRSAGVDDADAAATARPAGSNATVSAPSPRGGSLHGARTVLSGLSNLLASIAAVATGTASAGGGNGGGGLLPFAALAAFALMTPRLGRRLRLELATWPSSALVLSLERPG
jgi:hypothetical protein